MVEVVISRRAEDELREIWHYIAENSPAAADHVLLRIDAKLQALRTFPGIGTMRKDIRPGVRMMVEGHYLLLYEYREIEGVVELVSVIDGRRDLEALF